MTKEERLAQDGATNPILFYHAHNDYGQFSNFSPHGVVLRNPWTQEMQRYETGEHRYQAMKAVNEEQHDYVALARGPSRAKINGRKVDLREDWGQNYGDLCWYIMLETCLAKCIQHDDVLNLLADTEDRHIYEDSPTDDIWGWRFRSSYTGQNLLGNVWMTIRDLMDTQSS